MRLRGRQWPLVVWLALSLITVAIVPVAIFAGISAFLYAPQLREDANRQQLALANSLNGQIARYFSTATIELGVIESLLHQGDFGASQHAILDAFVSSSTLYEAIYLTDSAGKVTAIGLPASAQANRTNHLGQDFSRRPFYLAANRDQHTVWSDGFLSPVTSRMAIAVAHPMADQMLIGEVGIHQLPELAKGLASSSNLTLMLVDRSNQLVAHSGDLYRDQQFNVGNLPIVSAARHNLHGELIDFDFEGEALVGSARVIPGPDWLIVVAQNRTAAFAAITRMWGRIQLGIVISVISLVAAALVMARLLSNQFLRIGNQARVIGSGNYGMQHAQTPVVEFNLLQGDLQRMALAIQERETQMHTAQDELRELNSTLEYRVEERTDELTRANEEMVQTLDTLQRTQDELLHSEKLAALGSMVAGIAHELNTPIGNSLMAASTLEDHTQALSKEVDGGNLRRKVLLEFVQYNQTASGILMRNLQRAAELITSFKQVAVDQTSAQRRRFQVSVLVSEILVSLYPTLKTSDVSISTEIADEIWLDSYPGPLGQVLINLINNAVLHGFEESAQGQIRIAVTEPSAERIQIEVADDGCGIPPENLSKVFDPFFTTKLGKGGSGLGLNLVHNIVTGPLGGTIRVISQPGQGTSFLIDLPRVVSTARLSNDDSGRLV
jgi:C4-dicarboxylate-specific signal transduction histidine kinase